MDKNGLFPSFEVKSFAYALSSRSYSQTGSPKGLAFRIVDFRFGLMALAKLSQYSLE